MLHHVTFLHQTWKTRDVPVRFDAWRQSWLAHNPGAVPWLWTDSDARAFVAHREPGFLATYDALPHFIMRVDAVRYVWLRHLGGVYADLDTECTRPVDYLDGDGVHLLHEKMGPKDDTIGNAVMASSPGHPFWTHVLEVVMDRARRMLHSYASMTEPQKCHAVLKVTGPYMLTDALKSWEGGGMTVHAQEGCGVVHHGTGTWWRPTSSE